MIYTCISSYGSDTLALLLEVFPPKQMLNLCKQRNNKHLLFTCKLIVVKKNFKTAGLFLLKTLL